MCIDTWTCTFDLCTNIYCMNKLWSSIYTKMFGNTICNVYTWNIQRTMTLALYILVCTWAIQGIYLPVDGSSIFILFHTLMKQNLSLLKVFPLGMPNILAWTAYIQCCTMPVYRNQPFCTCKIHTGLYSLRMALACGQLSCGISSKHIHTRMSAPVHGFTMYSDVCTWKRQNATGKLITCKSHSEGVQTCMNPAYTERLIPVH
jgi:hypothetical protein